MGIMSVHKDRDPPQQIGVGAPFMKAVLHNDFAFWETATIYNLFTTVK